MPEAGEWATLKRLWPYLWPRDRRDLQVRVVIAIAVMVLGKVVTVLVPYTYKWATDALTQTSDGGGGSLPAFFTVPVMFVIAYGVAGVMAVVLNQLRDALFAKVSQHATRVVAYRTFSHMHQLSLRYHLQRRTGGLSRIIERGVKGIENIVRFSILNTIPTFIEFVLMAWIITVNFSFTYLIILVVAVYAYMWFTVKASDWRMNIRRKLNESDTEANSRAIDSLLNFETVKYFGNEEWERKRFDNAMAVYEKASIDTWTSLAWLNIGQRLIFAVAMILCMSLSANAVLKGEQTIGDFVMINAFLLQLAIPLNFIGFVYREIRQGLIDVSTMFSILEQKPEIEDKPDASALDVKQGEVRFKDVQFFYEEDRQILKGISFTVPPGKTVAIVGPSGAGKSTISRILFRFYDVAEGSVTIDGVNIKDITQESLRSHIGMVPQDTVLFNDTIEYNIRYGRPSATREEVEQAARMAQIEDFIQQLPQGYDTEVGERGLKLSGGEKQRVAIARTLLKGPPILMLDEATSALDTNTEREIKAALDEVSRDRTTLVIAHRLSTVIDADEIIVLKEGKIVERGTHQDLLDMSGLYEEMWTRQQEAAHAMELLADTGEYMPKNN